MTADDLDDVMAIEQSVVIAPFTRSGYKTELQNEQRTYEVLTINDEIIGYVGWYVMIDELHISIIAVHPQHQGQGHGETLLLNTLKQGFQNGATLATLEVRDSNHPAQGLYTKHGFKIVGRRKKYYQNREDALIMTLAPLRNPHPRPV